MLINSATIYEKYGKVINAKKKFFNRTIVIYSKCEGDLKKRRVYKLYSSREHFILQNKTRVGQHNNKC